MSSSYPLNLFSCHPEYNALVEQVHVEYFVNDKSFKERLQAYFIENQRSSYRIRLFNVLIKLLSCILYCVRVVYDEGTLPDMIAKTTNYSSNPNRLKIEYLIWVDRAAYLWLCQTVVGIISLVQTILIFYISYKGNILPLLLSMQFILELLTSIPFIVTIFVPPWREVFIPVFLNCWLAKSAFGAMLNDKNRATQKQQSALSQQIYILLAMLLCLLFTSTCGIQHLQRAGNRTLPLHTSLYFVIVTFSTVGYGDIYPDYWMSQLFVILMICIAIGTLPTQ
uniref:Potassium channel domain-containing protein n=1 Tax=Plectus sambesii TaxID=2011161 RepID=A0A914V2D5_9BILA